MLIWVFFILIIILFFILPSFSFTKEVLNKKYFFNYYSSNRYLFLAKFWIFQSISFSIISYLTLRIIGEQDHLNDFKYDILEFLLFAISGTLFFSAFVCRNIAFAGKGKQEKAYKMSVSKLDFAYVLVGFAAAIWSLAYITSSGFQSFSNASIFHDEELLKNERNRFISAMELIESHCFNNELSTDICKRSKIYESYLFSIVSPFAVKFDAQDICYEIRLLKGNPYLGDQRISNFCHNPTYELTKQRKQNLVDLLEKTRIFKYSELLESIVFKILLVITLSARFTKAIFDLLYNQCDLRKGIKIRPIKLFLKLRR